MSTISFMTANYVARQLNYHMTAGWGQGDSNSQEHFKPLETFSTRFETYLADIQAMGFTAIDMWTGILHPSWATSEHIQQANALLAQYQFPVISLAGGLGATPAEFEASCRLASGLHTQILAGGTSLIQQNRDAVVSMLQDYNLRLGLENHPEKTPEEMLTQIGDGGKGRIGTTVDTGWYGTQGYDAAKAIERLGQFVFAVHLKDVLEPGKHDTCRYGQGCVPIRACVEALPRIGYQGTISVEHEPEHFDPTEDCKACLALLKEWLA
jgi:sugar phosphate isomerase/epimerase